MNLKYCLTGILCLFLKSDAQIKPLTIGDIAPDVVIKNIHNYPALQSNLSAFNNKLLILDFMATNCSSCIKALPAFDALQKKYKDKIQIILITNQKEEKVKKFLQQHSELKLPMVSNDSILSKLFPHEFISHEVWIHKGMVKAITHTEYVNNKNIDAILANVKVDWPVKRDVKFFNYSNHLLKENDDNISNSDKEFFYSTLTGYIPEVAPKFISSVDSTKHTIRTFLVNMPVIDLYRQCYGLTDLPISHILFKVKDTLHYVYKKEYGYREIWKKEHTYCYEAVLPLQTIERLRSKMVADLDFYLNMNVSIDTLLTPVYKLTHADTSLKLFTRDASRDIAKVDGSMSISVQELISFLNKLWYGIPTINATGFSGKDYINIPQNCEDNFPLLQTSLSRYGLQLNKANYKTWMLVVREK